MAVPDAARESLQDIAIVGGCGRVGLPLGLALADRGCHVQLVDTATEQVARINGGVMPFYEQGGEELLARMLKADRLRATSEVAAIAKASTVLITIGTPVDNYLDPSFRAFDRAFDNLVQHMHVGQPANSTQHGLSWNDRAFGPAALRPGAW